jgi:hypothetical protein
MAKSKIPSQIKEALDGRTQRWLSQKMGITEDMFSKKMKEVVQFTREEIDSINEILSSEITYPKEIKSKR